MIGLLVHTLKSFGIIDKDNTVNVKFSKKLMARPALLQRVISSTQFLRYNAPILARIHCLLQRITVQPVCKMCGIPTKMRLTGRARYTFPQYCSGRCAAKDKLVQQKREQTNLERYGSKYNFKKSIKS